MKLESIGFYTLDDDRARSISITSPLWRCELLLTDKCNFHCPYCRGANQWTKGTLSYKEAERIVDLWASHNLQNIRFSGGEPTLWKGLDSLVAHARKQGIKRIAISTNGSADIDTYGELIHSGVNDFSISLDACCASTGDIMAGGISGAWDRVIEAIKFISGKAYCTVGVVLTESNFEELPEIIQMASGLGVSDIRIISAAQWNDEAKWSFSNIPDSLLAKHPILKYRIENFRAGRNVRGIAENASHHCWLGLDDMVIAGEWHFPCVIAMREGCAPIGTIKGKTMAEIREERRRWIEENDTHNMGICKGNCLDVCQAFINKVEDFKLNEGNNEES